MGARTANPSLWSGPLNPGNSVRDRGTPLSLTRRKSAPWRWSRRHSGVSFPTSLTVIRVAAKRGELAKAMSVSSQGCGHLHFSVAYGGSRRAVSAAALHPRREYQRYQGCSSSTRRNIPGMWHMHNVHTALKLLLQPPHNISVDAAARYWMWVSAVWCGPVYGVHDNAFVVTPSAAWRNIFS